MILVVVVNADGDFTAVFIRPPMGKSFPHDCTLKNETGVSAVVASFGFI